MVSQVEAPATRCGRTSEARPWSPAELVGPLVAAIRWLSRIQSVATPLQPGDIVVRGCVDGGYEILDAMSLERLAVPVHHLGDVIAIARASHARTIWQQPTDSHGNNLGDPVPLQIIGLD